MATATKAQSRIGSGLRFTISREMLIEGLAAIAPSTPSKTTLPVLGNLLLETTDRGLRLSGTDLDIAVSIEVVADIEMAGAITVPAKRLLSIAKELPPAPVRFSTKSDGKVLVDCGRAHFQLLTLPREEFPLFPEVNFSGPTWSLKGSDLQSLAKRTAFATSGEGSRPILNGILVQLDGSLVRFVATDGHVLAHVEAKTEQQVGASAADLIIMPRAFEHVARLFGSDEDIEIARTENHLGFRNDLGASVTTRLIEGPYPNYRQVIPKKHHRTATVDRHSLVSSVRRMVPIASDSTRRLKLAFKEGKLELHAMTPDIGEGSDEVSIKLEGDGLTIGVNASYLLDVLARIDSDEVLIKTGESNRAMIFRSLSDASEESAFFLIMPLRVDQ